MNLFHWASKLLVRFEFLGALVTLMLSEFSSSFVVLGMWLKGWERFGFKTSQSKEIARSTSGSAEAPEKQPPVGQSFYRYWLSTCCHDATLCCLPTEEAWSVFSMPFVSFSVCVACLFIVCWFVWFVVWLLLSFIRLRVGQTKVWVRHGLGYWKSLWHRQELSKAAWFHSAVVLSLASSVGTTSLNMFVSPICQTLSWKASPGSWRRNFPIDASSATSWTLRRTQLLQWTRWSWWLGPYLRTNLVRTPVFLNPFCSLTSRINFCVCFGQPTLQQVQLANCETHGKCMRAPPGDERTEVGVEGPPCVLFSSLLDMALKCRFLLSLFAIVCESIPKSVNMGAHITAIWSLRMGKQEGMATKNKQKKEVHDVWLKDKLDRKFLEWYSKLLLVRWFLVSSELCADPCVTLTVL